MHVEQKLKKIPVWFWLLLVALIILGLLVSPWFFVIAILGPFDEILFIIVLLLFIKAIRIVFFRKSDVTDKKTAIFSVLMLILVITSVFLFTVDIEALYEVSQNHEYYYTSNVVGISMHPQVFNRDLFVIQSNIHPEYTLSVGDILIYTYEDMYIGHRVVGIYDDYYLTKGDYNEAVETVYPAQVVGRVYKTINRANIIGVSMFRWANQ